MSCPGRRTTHPRPAARRAPRREGWQLTPADSKPALEFNGLDCGKQGGSRNTKAPRPFGARLRSVTLHDDGLEQHRSSTQSLQLSPLAPLSPGVAPLGPRTKNRPAGLLPCHTVLKCSPAATFVPRPTAPGPAAVRDEAGPYSSIRTLSTPFITFFASASSVCRAAGRPGPENSSG